MEAMIPQSEVTIFKDLIGDALAKEDSSREASHGGEVLTGSPFRDHGLLSSQRTYQF